MIRTGVGLNPDSELLVHSATQQRPLFPAAKFQGLYTGRLTGLSLWKEVGGDQLDDTPLTLALRRYNIYSVSLIWSIVSFLF